MDQELALAIMCSGESVFLTGPAGSGKTYVLNEFIRRLKDDGKKVAVTATTGLAASHLGGTTIHAWSGIGIHDQLPDNFFTHMSKSRREAIEKVDCLIIDEISMLHGMRLDMVDEILRKVRKNDEVSFGGVQIILSGDFFQLPPVTRGGGSTSDFVFASRSWEELDPVICYLSTQYRQTEGDAYADILTAIRTSDVRRHHAEALLARVVDDSMLEEMTELHTTNSDVDRINQKKLDQLPGDEITFSMYTTGGESYVASLKKSCLAPETLRLKEGVLVMALKNSPLKQYANGSIGRVVGFEESTLYPIVLFHSGKKITMMPDTWELRDGDKKRASLSQIPLRLAYAITVHKSQGMTLDAARIDLRRAFVEGMGYVALSRVRTIENLQLVGINKIALRVNAAATDIDETLRRKAAKDAKRLEHLKVAFKEKAPTPKVNTASTWEKKITEMRKDHPNAYRPWKKEDDTLLKEKFQLGASIQDLSKQLGRHEGSIERRLQKHFGDDIVA